ncbi:centrosomal protein of 72 kDa [Corythoichthys intestinalis]|uniref:centrosomal protein of 72 kDa n=1 Tax=Corythoichthys intestinalis TaxID=161448 RepID=UPI0025A5CF2A|nr:centrosomal protein of 72 kDa [Corythoichthys intestinalis]
MAPVTLVALTEEWIMNKLGLPHKRLGDVRSLSLPGNYKQKIGSLGNGLANFGRLKSLNLAHNSLVSVEGVQHLKQLNVLNLYYNCIPSIKEVKVLFELPALRDLDLRLNPIAKIEPHYRPYVVHAMDNLRKLDGYPVKHFERQAAKKQFSQQRSHDDKQVLVDRLVTKSPLPSDTVHQSSITSNQDLETTHQQPGTLLDASLTTACANMLKQVENKQKSYCKPLEELLELMDKHWVGERTLQLDTNFLIQIVQILSMMENHISNQEAKVMNLKKEVGAWCVFAATQERDHDADMKKVTANLDELNMQLRTALEENVALQRELRMSQQAQRTVDELRIQVEKP